MLRPGFARCASCIQRTLVVAGVLAVLTSPASSQMLRTETTGTVVGAVVMKENGLPLPYSTVSVPALSKQRFTNDSGTFTFSDLPVGPNTLRVRHLGYSPVDITVDVRPGGTETVRVVLTHIVVQLSPVQVRADAECVEPGVPTALGDSAFLMVFDQLRLNADQYRLLTDHYPFRTLTERRLAHTLVNGDLRIDSIDTLVIDSRLRWTYRPGDVLTRSGQTRYNSGTLMLNIPTIAQFADQPFLDNHCFYNGGTETIDGVELLRVDFVAAARINTPDVSGSMYLDPKTFQIRRSVLRLSRIPREVAGLLGTEAVTVFQEALPSVPVIAGITSVNRLENNRRGSSTAFMNEQQTLLKVEFMNGRPGDQARIP
jgi:CarboxypepD_reg-like domain